MRTVHDARDRVFTLDGRFGAAGSLLERASGLSGLSRIYREIPEGLAPEPFLRRSLDALGVAVRIADEDLARIPREGPVLVVANHPHGAVEGMALALELLRVRPDAKILANFLLARIPEIRDLFLRVDPFGTDAAHRGNRSGIRSALRWLAGGGLLATFPAGEVAHLDLARRAVLDPPWSPGVAGLARHAGCPVVPIWFSGRNGAMFQLAGLLHPMLRTALLPRELLGRRGTTLEIRVGTPIPASRLTALGSDEERIRHLRERTEILGRRARRLPPAVQEPVQPRATPVSVEPVVPPEPQERLADEVARLGDGQRLVEAEGMEVYVARAGEIPSVLREIGRLREITFRAVGEGTGRSIDLDAFDAYYRHLFVWNRERREIVGAYRLGVTEEILAERGVAGLYTSTLFDYDAALFERMGPAIEMGRSFVRTEYQKSLSGLFLLWKGIGAFVVRHPRWGTLFGPVSISADYQSISQQLMVAFLERNNYVHPWSRHVRPRNPFRPRRRDRADRSPSTLRDLEDVSTFISEIEADQKGVPILIKQYLKLDGRLLGYNVDPDFSNVLDVLLMVDLRRTEKRILARYMGREGVERFLSAAAA